MHCRSLKASCVAAALLAGAAVAHGQQSIPSAPFQKKAAPGKRVTVPVPLHLPVLWPEIDQAGKEASINELAWLVRQAPVGQRSVVMQGLCVQVPAGFCEKAGLSVAGRDERKKAAAGVWTLSQREARMFGALLRS